MSQRLTKRIIKYNYGNTIEERMMKTITLNDLKQYTHFQKLSDGAQLYTERKCACGEAVYVLGRGLNSPELGRIIRAAKLKPMPLVDDEAILDQDTPVQACYMCRG